MRSDEWMDAADIVGASVPGYSSTVGTPVQEISQKVLAGYVRELLDTSSELRGLCTL